MSDPVEKIYRELYGHSMDLLEEYEAPVEAVAGALMAIAMRLYKTTLSEENFKKMKEVILETDIEPYKKRKLH
tara:strand:+ start:799 stop:1017 length:219 start_codon:yes stop_codon:yes gene_type:complete